MKSILSGYGLCMRTVFSSVLRNRSIMTTTRIPSYQVTGTHYECSYAIGKLTSEAIRRRLTDDATYLSTLFQFVQTDFGRNLHEDFLDAIRTFYPWYWDEMRGLADGAAIPLEQILVLNFLNETRTAFRLQKEKERYENETGEKGCSTVLLNRKNADLFSILHNEDHSPALLHTAFLVQANIHSTSYDDGKRQSPEEKFIAYCYAGAIPGNAFGANVHGLACSLNGLYPNFVAQGRLPRQIVNRALLAVKNEQDLDHLLHSAPVAYGFSVNAGFYHSQSYLLNYEVGPNLKLDNENYVSKCRIVSSGETIDNDAGDCIQWNYLVHYNHYERLDNVIVQQKSLESTHSRWQRGQEIGEIVDLNDALRLLGDDENKDFPIFRIGNRSDIHSATLCTVHFNLRTLKMFVYEENPKENPRPSLIFDLADLFHI